MILKGNQRAGGRQMSLHLLNVEQNEHVNVHEVRGYVAVDLHGEVYSLTRQLGQKAKALEARLGKPENLPSVAEVKTSIDGRLSKLFKTYSDELTALHKDQAKPLRQAKASMIKDHRNMRSKLDYLQKDRWQGEELKRSERIRRGFKGIWDKLNGRYWKTRKRNERETWQAHIRDQKQREELIQQQLAERQGLQNQLKILQENQEKERSRLIRDLSHATKSEKIKNHKQKKAIIKDTRNHKKHSNQYDRDDPDIDFGPEI